MGSCRLPRWLVMVGLLATAGSARADCTKPISIGLVKRTPGSGGPRDDRGTNRQIPAFRGHRVARFGLIDEWHVDVGKSQSKNEMCKKASLA